MSHNHFVSHPPISHCNTVHYWKQISHSHVFFQTCIHRYSMNHQAIDVCLSHAFPLVATVRCILLYPEKLLFLSHEVCILCDRFIRCRFDHQGIWLCFRVCFHHNRYKCFLYFLVILPRCCEELVSLLPVEN